MSISRLGQDLAAPTRWPALDGVRGLALIAVVNYHLVRFIIDDGDHRLSWPWWTLMGTARLGLDAFFVLSGLLIVVSWRATRRHAGLGEALRVFWKRRARRILPAYWLSLAVFAPLLAPDLFTSLEGAGKLALFVLVQQNVVNNLANQVNTPYWTLTTEFHFYVLVPIVAWAILRRGRWVALAATMALSVAWWFGLRGDMAASFIFGRLDQFLVGAIVGDIVSRASPDRPSRLVSLLSTRRAAWILGAALLAVGTWHGSRQWGVPATWFDRVLHPVAGLILAGLLLHLLCARRGGVLARPVLRFAGLVSYSVYLWHYPLQHRGLAWMGVEPGAPIPVINLLAACVVITAVVAAVGVASYLLAERPFLRRHERTGAAGPGEAAAVAARPAAGR